MSDTDERLALAVILARRNPRRPPATIAVDIQTVFRAIPAIHRAGLDALQEPDRAKLERSTAKAARSFRVIRKTLGMYEIKSDRVRAYADSLQWAFWLDIGATNGTVPGQYCVGNVSQMTGR